MIELAPNVTLAQTFSNLLSDTVFLFTESVPDPPPQLETWWRAQLTMEQQNYWEFSVCIEPTLALTVSANLLGIENDSEQAQGATADAVGEFANILAGALAVEVYGTNTICHLGIPEVSLDTGGNIQTRWEAATRRIHYITDEGQHLLLMLTEVARS